MEVFMRNLPYGLTELQLTRELEPFLHGPDFRDLSGGAPFNFIIRLLKGKKRRNQKQKDRGLGKLLLPSEDIGNRLLFLVRVAPFFVHRRPIFMEKSKCIVQPDDLAVLKEPYQDPAIQEAQEQRRAEIAGTMPIINVNFGWECHDGKVSLEWSSRLTETWNIEFLPDTHSCVLRSKSGLSILIALRAVHSAALGSTTCLLWLERAPIFEKTKNSPIPIEYDDDDPIDDLVDGLQATSLSDKTTRNRLVTLDPTHGGIFAFLRVVRVTFNTHNSAQEFKAKSRKIGLSLDAEYPELVQRDLVSSAVLLEFARWMRCFPYEIAFQLEGLLSRARFNPKELLELRPRLTAILEQHPSSTISACIRVLDQWRDENPEASAVTLFFELIAAMKKDGQVRSFMQPTPDLFHCHRVTVTPTSLILQGPLPDETNRVIRKYADYTSNFMRVEFREEDRLQFRWDREVDGDAFIDERVGGVLKEGIVVAGRKFEFLAYSSSALREHAVWFMTPFRTKEGELVTPDSIRKSLGRFDKVINCPARYGARLSQAFSATEESVTVEVEEVLVTPDKESASKSCFTDGVGLISQALAEEIWEKYTEARSKRSRRRLQAPTAFQIRMGGYKGMLCVYDGLDEDCSMQVRPSMDKFTSTDYMIEIARAFDRPMLMYLNRPLIMLLETLGVPLQPFMELQQAAVEETQKAANSFESAARLLEQHGLGTAYRMTSIMLQLHRLDADLQSTDQELVLMQFLKRVLKFSVNHVFRDLKYKARIPVKKAWTLVGVADEWDYLNEDEIFAYVCTIDGHKEYLEGDIMISRSPTVHPGDARMVRAIGKPPNAPSGLTSLTNCVVFPCKGERSLPSMLAGGDLDGDIYCLVTDEKLFPPRQHPPGSYTSPEHVKLDRPANANDVADFVVNYVKNDLLGIIATQLLLDADSSPQCMADPNCLRLAALHSDAVDFPKTGRPVAFEQLPKPRTRKKPDWYANETVQTNRDDSKFYPSNRIIGHLFRAITLPAVPEAKRVARQQQRLLDNTEDSLDVGSIRDSLSKDDSHITRRLRYRLRDLDIDVNYFEDNTDDIITEMLDSYERYAGELSYLCKTHSLSPKIPLSEEEIVAGTIVAKCSQPRMRQDLTSAMRRDATSLGTVIREEIEGSEDASEEDLLQRAWIAWKVALAAGESFGAKSFGLLALDVMFSALRKMEQELRHSENIFRG
ncbi:RdRP-domain-containing protein [Serendipita vermifera]|nr:RdRP-domain-containing protein [Serendipita vermifera]